MGNTGVGSPGDTDNLGPYSILRLNLAADTGGTVWSVLTLSGGNWKLFKLLINRFLETPLGGGSCMTHIWGARRRH